MHADLQQACYGALAVPRHDARSRALGFSWAHSTRLFLGHLVPARRGQTGSLERVGIDLGVTLETVARHGSVTPLSSNQ
jgi:hypothetical protein